MTRARGGDKTSAAHRQQRRRKATELLAKGVPQSEIEKELQVSRMTLFRDLKQITEQMKLTDEQTVVKLREYQLRVFELMESKLLEGWPADVVREWRSIRASISDLLGLNVPTNKSTFGVGVYPTGADGKPVSTTIKVEFNGVDADTLKNSIFNPPELSTTEPQTLPPERVQIKSIEPAKTVMQIEAKIIDDFADEPHDADGNWIPPTHVSRRPR